MNHKGVCRTAPATPGLLKIDNDNYSNKISMWKFWDENEKMKNRRWKSDRQRSSSRTSIFLSISNSCILQDNKLYGIILGSPTSQIQVETEQLVYPCTSLVAELGGVLGQHVTNTLFETGILFRWKVGDERQISKDHPRLGRLVFFPFQTLVFCRTTSSTG